MVPGLGKTEKSLRTVKQLHIQVFANISLRIELVREELNGVQGHLKVNLSDGNLHSQEREKSELLKKWLRVKESALKQKSRNNHFFFTAMKERFARNSIDVCLIMQARGCLLKWRYSKKVQVITKKMLGSRASILHGVDISVLRKGPQLSGSACHELVQPVSEAEIDVA